jgi:hypothetical protein
MRKPALRSVLFALAYALTAPVIGQSGGHFRTGSSAPNEFGTVDASLLTIPGPDFGR